MPRRRPDAGDVRLVRNAVQLVYTRLVFEPARPFDLHHGAGYAVRWLGYDARALARLPASVTSAFVGVGNPHVIAPFAPGQTIVDLGCGSGTDLLLAADAVGPAGRVVGIDMTEEMRQRAIAGAAELGLTHVDIKAADLVSLPLAAASADVIICNGVLALVPEKRRAMAEMARVARPGARLCLSDTVLADDGDEPDAQDVDLWTSGIGGAWRVAELIDGFAQAGFRDLQVTARFDCYRGTVREPAARRYGVIGINLSGLRN